MKTCVHVYLAVLGMKNASDKSSRGSHGTHFMFSKFILEVVLLRDNVGKYDRARQATDDNVEHVHYILDN
jgi:hypothetical protein